MLQEEGQESNYHQTGATNRVQRLVWADVLGDDEQKVPCEVVRYIMELDVKGKVKEKTRKIGDDDLCIGKSDVGKKGEGRGKFYSGENRLWTKSGESQKDTERQSNKMITYQDIRHTMSKRRQEK